MPAQSNAVSTFVTGTGRPTIKQKAKADLAIASPVMTIKQKGDKRKNTNFFDKVQTKAEKASASAQSTGPEAEKIHRTEGREKTPARRSREARGDIVVEGS